ncbi:MAG: hypothetical protein WAO91_10480 [Candidatus Nitrosotenuis sp.]
MDQILSEQRFNEQVALLLSLKQTIQDNGWVIDVVFPDLFCKIHPRNHSDIIFMLRLRCNDYPSKAPSLQFVDPATKKEGKEFWPKQGDAFIAAVGRGPPPQLCIEGIREFHEGCHASPNDQIQYPWKLDKYTFANILERVQILLNKAYP